MRKADETLGCFKPLYSVGGDEHLVLMSKIAQKCGRCVIRESSRGCFFKECVQRETKRNPVISCGFFDEGVALSSDLMWV